MKRAITDFSQRRGFEQRTYRIGYSVTMTLQTTTLPVSLKFEFMENFGKKGMDRIKAAQTTYFNGTNVHRVFPQHIVRGRR